MEIFRIRNSLDREAVREKINALNQFDRRQSAVGKERALIANLASKNGLIGGAGDEFFVLKEGSSVVNSEGGLNFG
jgi:hypothetical protein